MSVDGAKEASARETVSVVIATNRGGPFLADAVASLRAQTVPPDEIILVDDGSPRGLDALAAELGVVYVRQTASGISVARNRGMAMVHSTWVGFLDDDDIWFPERIERQLAALKTRPEAIAAYSDMAIIDAESAVIGAATAPIGSSLEIMALGRAKLPPINSLLVRRDAYIVVGGCEPGLRWAEDLDLILRLLRIGEFVKVPGRLTGYRRHDGQTSSRQWPGSASYLTVVRALIRRAARDGDRLGLAALRRHLRRTVPWVADWWAGELISRLWHLRLREAAAVLGWGIRHLRTAVVPAMLRVLPQRLRLLRP